MNLASWRLLIVFVVGFSSLATAEEFTAKIQRLSDTHCTVFITNHSSEHLICHAGGWACSIRPERTENCITLAKVPIFQGESTRPDGCPTAKIECEINNRYQR